MSIRWAIFFSTVLLISSCATTSFYQVYSVKPIGETITIDTNKLIYEDSNCKISYNLWANGGDIGFNFYNKTDDIICVKLNKSYFILNGFAYDYFKNRTYTKRFVSIKEDSLIYIPPKTTKKISEYSINNTLIRNCNLLKYPRVKEIKTISYSVEKSPIVFSNRITYEINGNSKLVENKFYISEITNYPESRFFELRNDEYCGQKSFTQKKYYRFYNVDRFYIRYDKIDYDWDH